MIKNYALVNNTEDYTNIQIIRGTLGEAMKIFKESVEGCVNSQCTVSVAVVELNEDGTGRIDIDYEISGDGFSLTFAPEEKYFDEDTHTFDEFYNEFLEENN